MCILSGALLALAYHFESLWWLCLIALVPFCSVMLSKKQGYREILKHTVMFEGAYYCCLLPWLFEIAPVIASGVGEFTSNVIMALAIVTIAVLMGSLYALPMLIFKRLYRQGISDAIVLAVLYVTGELIISLLGELAFPWGRLANIAVPSLPFVQGAALGGSLLVSLIIILINAFVARFVLFYKADKVAAYLSLAAAAIIFAVNILGGSIAISASNSCLEKAEKTEILAVQGNFPSSDKWIASNAEMLDRYLELSAQGVTNDTKLVVWPETAIPTDIDRSSYGKKIQTFATEHNVTVVVGYLKETSDGTFNAMRVFIPGDDPSTDVEPEFYAKQLLVPMGEFTPLSEIFGTVMPGVMGDLSARNLTHGDKTVIFDTPCGDINGVICYESILPSVQLDASRKGSGLITMITNDSWFGKSTALRQHLSHAQLRAVESGKYLIRAGNSGITAAISPSGEVYQSIEIYKSGYMRTEACFIYSPTLYTVIGDIPFYALGCACIILFVLDIIIQNKGEKCKISFKHLAK